MGGSGCGLSAGLWDYAARVDKEIYRFVRVYVCVCVCVCVYVRAREFAVSTIFESLGMVVLL